MFQFTIESLTFEQIAGIVLQILFPGIVFMYNLRFWIAMDKIRTTDLTLAACLGFINFALFEAIFHFFHIEHFLFIYLLILPLLVPLIWKWIIKTPFYKKNFVLFYDTAFDFAMNTGQLSPILVVHLKSGKTVAGLFVDGKSFYSAVPNSGDIFLSVEFEVSKEGKLIYKDDKPVPIKLSKGLLIRANEYCYLEVFDIK